MLDENLSRILQNYHTWSFGDSEFMTRLDVAYMRSARLYIRIHCLNFEDTSALNDNLSIDRTVHDLKRFSTFIVSAVIPEEKNMLRSGIWDELIYVINV